MSDTNSPKTPGGISKSLLTPCRRLGLSRKFRRAGPSPFVSPLTKENSSPPVQQEEKRATRRERAKVQQCVEEENEVIEKESETTLEHIGHRDGDMEIVSTPVRTLSVVTTTPLRSVQLPGRTKSKTLITAINNVNDQQPIESTPEPIKNIVVPDKSELQDKNISNVIKNTNTGKEIVSKPVRTLSKTKKSTSKTKILKADKEASKPIVETNKVSSSEISNEGSTKEKSPNNLSKECFVVVQRKIFKDSLKSKDTINPVSQAVFDSDSDDVPLSTMANKTEEKLDTDVRKRPRTDDNDDDFCEILNSSVKVTKLEHKNTSTTDLKKMLPKNMQKDKKVQIKSHVQTLQTFDDDDEDFECKKTILIRKSYDKVIKPSRAKSTGSITQQDIEQLKARIETKKNLLLAKSINNETEELRSLIKKWRRGCQEALGELTDLMKLKLGDQNMNSSDILKMLNIPTNLVGYDSDNDCFVSPDDSSVILFNY